MKGEVKEELSVDLPGLDEDLKREIEERIKEFEEKYEELVFKCVDAMVPRIKNRDYMIAIGINAILVIYMIAVLMSGGG